MFAGGHRRDRHRVADADLRRIRRTVLHRHGIRRQRENEGLQNPLAVLCARQSAISILIVFQRIVVRRQLQIIDPIRRRIVELERIAAFTGTLSPDAQIEIFKNSHPACCLVRNGSTVECCAPADFIAEKSGHMASSHVDFNAIRNDDRHDGRRVVEHPVSHGYPFIRNTRHGRHAKQKNRHQAGRHPSENCDIPVHYHSSCHAHVTFLLPPRRTSASRRWRPSACTPCRAQA